MTFVFAMSYVGVFILGAATGIGLFLFWALRSPSQNRLTGSADEVFTPSCSCGGTCSLPHN